MHVGQRDTTVITMWLHTFLCITVHLIYGESRDIDVNGINLFVTNLQGKDWGASNETFDVIVDQWEYIRNNTAVQQLRDIELRLACEADFPIVWNITGHLKQPEVMKIQPHKREFLPSGNFSYMLSVNLFFEVDSLSSSTFSCQSVESPEIKKSLDVFRQGDEQQELVDNGKRLQIETSKTIPCSVTNPNVEVTLRKLNVKSRQFEIVTRGFQYHPRHGFVFEKPVEGEFSCETTANRVLVTATISKSTVFDHDYLPRKRNIKVFTSESVRLECASRVNQVNITMLSEVNVVVQKFPTQSATQAALVVFSNGTKVNSSAVCKNDLEKVIWTWEIEFVEPPELYLDNYEGEVDCLSLYEDRTISTVRCVNPSHCEFMKHCFEDPSLCNDKRQKQFFSNDTAICWLDEQEVSKECVRVPYSHLNGIVECKVRGLARHWMFFHTLESTKSFDYHNHNDGLSELIQMDNISPILHTNITSKFFCKAVIFLVADSIKFEMIFANGSTVIMLETENPEGEDGRRIEEGNVIGKLNTRVPLDAVGIRCLAPLWNSSEFLTIERRFITRHLQKPIIQGTSSNVVVSETRNRLNCSAIGEPQPTYMWRKDGNVIQHGDRHQFISGVNGESLLEFLIIDNAIRGEYTCEASNNVDFLLGECESVSNVSDCGINSASKLFRVEDLELSGFKSATAAFSATIAIVLLILLCVCMILVVVLRKYLNAREFIRNLTEQEIEEFFNGNPALLNSSGNLGPEYLDLLPYDRHYELDLDDIRFDLSKVLGEGEFSTVVQGHWVPQMKDVAVKIAKPSADVALFKNLLSEVKIMIHIGGHTNILSLLGVCTKNIRNRNIYIVVELCENGSLDILLRKNRRTFINLLDGNQHIDTSKADIGAPGKKITTLTLVRWSGEIACGMEFLAFKGVVHADLAARNVLIGPNWEAKISDFGLSRKLYECTNYVKKTKTPLPWRWMASESLQSLSFSTDSDIWSYGVTLWEIFTLGDVPFPNESWDKEFLNRIATGMRMGKPKFANPEIYSQIVACWDEDPSLRPPFANLRKFFLSLYEQHSGESKDMVNTALRATSYYKNYLLENSLKSGLDNDKVSNEVEVEPEEQEKPHLYGNVDLVGNEMYSNALV